MRKLEDIVDSIQTRIEVAKVTYKTFSEKETIYVIRSKAIRAEAAKVVSEIRAEPIMEVVIRPHKKKFSREQQNRCMEIIRQISEKKAHEGLDENGETIQKYYSVDSWLEYFRQMFIGVEEMPSGKTKGLPTSKLSTSEYNDFMTQIEAWASENDVSIVLNTL